MEELSLSALAGMIAADLLRAHPALGTRGAEDLTLRVETALGTAVRPKLGVPEPLQWVFLI